MKLRSKSFFLVLIFSLVGGALFTNCSSSSSSNSNPIDSGQSNLSTAEKIETLGSQTYSLLNIDYSIQLLKVSSPSLKEPVYAEYIKGCSSQCPLMVISAPYDGLTWSQNLLDQTWAQRPNATSGYFWADENGPGYDPKAAVSGHLYFTLHTPQELAAMGGLSLPNNTSLLIILNRFYAGRNLNEYVNEFSTVSDLFISQNLSAIKKDKVAFWGASLGGFIPLHSSLRVQYKPAAMVLISPLVDLHKQIDYLNNIPNVTNAVTAGSYADFFDPYLRRIYDFTGGTPTAKPSAFTPWEIEQFSAHLTTPTLIFHDTWDVLVPVSQSSKLTNARTDLFEPVYFQHAQGISFETFHLDHSQYDNPSYQEGMNKYSLIPFYNIFMAQFLNDPSETVTIWYDYKAFAEMLAEFKLAQGRGQDISWLKNRLLSLCRDNLVMNDYTNTLGQVRGKQMLAGILKNIWSVDQTEDQVCSYLQSHKFPF